MTTKATRDGTIFTFYSFKGGVGRTLALANVGIILSRWGYRVLLIDWDLEAPGLKDYLAPLHKGLVQGGVVDLLADSSDDGERWKNYIVRLNGTQDLGELDYLAAGGSVRDYHERVQGLDLNALYETARLGPRLEAMRDAWKHLYDVVLIDSRTGLSDIGGICTVQLPDILCACFTTNRQSFYGALDVARRVNRQRVRLSVDRAGVLTAPLLTRFESSVEFALAQEWERQIAEHVTDLLTEWVPADINTADLLAHLRVPYVPHWSFGESLPAIADDANDPLSVAYALETIAALVARNLADPGLLVRNRPLYVSGAVRSGASARTPTSMFTADFALYYDQRDLLFATQLTKALEDAGFKVLAEGAFAKEDDAAAAAAQHIVLIIGETPSTQLQNAYRDLLLGLVEADSSRILIPVVHVPGGARRLPANMRSLQWIDASDRHPDTVARDVARRVGRQLDDVAPTESAAPLDGWFDVSVGRFQELLKQRSKFEPLYELGYWMVGYAFEPPLTLEIGELREALRASIRREIGWPEWMWPDWEDIRPRVVGENIIECWLARDKPTFAGGSSADFWRASPHGLTFLLRGYQEDDELPDEERGRGFDINLPVWRVGEALLHASGMAAFTGSLNSRIRFRAAWQGLAGRHLISLGKRRLLTQNYEAAQDSFTHDIALFANDIESSLPQAVYDLVKDLYSLFDFFELPFSLVEEELAQLRALRN